MYKRITPLPPRSFFLLGPRGTGKSTWLRAALPRAHRIDLLDEALYHEYLARPGAFAGELATLARGSWVIVDEVQRLPQLLNEVHRAIEDRGLRFALCGSSARKLKQQGVNLLAGRALHREMHPFVPEELGRDFSLERALAFGALPVIWTAEEPGEALSAYARMYLREEIQAEALVRNLPGFARFLPIAALLHAQTLNVAAVARDAGVARTTVNGYLEILEDTLIAFRLPAFETKLRVRERAHPKLYLFDPGVARALKGAVQPKPSPEERGPLFEGLVASLLRAYRSYADLYEEWAFWAPAEATRTEVDFVLRRGRELIGIEVKSAPRVRGEELSGLRAFAELAQVVRRICVFTGSRRELTPEGIELMPFGAFAAELAERSLWP